jgi:glutathione S-transferase
MAKYKVSYFDMPASRGEECRLALVLSGEDFEDDRIAFKDWPDRKKQMPFGAIPVLTVEGQGMLCHSNAILNYLGTAHGLRPTDAWQAARHDGIMESVEEMRIKIWAALRTGQTEEEKKTIRLEMAETVIAPWAQNIQSFIVGPFLFGEKIHVADLKLWALCQWLTTGVIDHLPTELLAPYERLTALHAAVAADPRIAAFRATHAK